MNPGELITRFKDRWMALSQTHKIIIAVVTAALLAGLIYGVFLASRPNYATLFSGLDPKEAGTIVEKLKGMKIPYQLTDQGKTILVPEQQVLDTRIQLAGSGALNGGGNGIGFELFDQNKFGQTDFEQQVSYQRALQEELRRTIVHIEGVEQARIHLVIPPKSVFVKDQGIPTASVALSLKPSARLKPEQVQGICDLFVGSVEGLKPENVHIIDTAGNVLSDNLQSKDPRLLANRVTLEQQQAQRSYEKELEKRIQQVLIKIMGQDQAVVMVSAELDFSQQQTTSTVASNPDSLKVSEHNIKESGKGNDPGGAAGTDSNVTTTPFAQGNSSSDYNREENTTNYQISTKQETVVKAPGALKRVSVAVAVNEVPGQDMEKVKDVVSASMGYDPGRGDQITVSSLAFDDSYQRKADAALANAARKAKEKVLLIYTLLSAVLAAIILGTLLYMLMKRRHAYEELLLEYEEEDTLVPAKSLDDLEMEAEQKSREDRSKRVRVLAKEKPVEVAEILKLWISE